MKHSLLPLFLVSFFAVSAEAETLKPLMKQLLSTHPRIQAEQEKVAAASAGRQQARASFLPRVDGSASTGYENTDRTALYPPAGKYNFNPKYASLTVTQNVFEGFRGRGAVNVAEAGIAQAEAGLEATRQQVMFEAISSYLTTLKQKKLTELADSNMHNLQTQLHLEDERVERGSGIAVDVLQAKSRLQIAKERHTAFNGALRDAISNYAQLFGAPPADVLELPEVPLTAVPGSLDAAISKAEKSSPALQGIAQSAQAARHQKTVATAGYFPSVDVVAATNYKEDAAGIGGKEKSNTLLVRSTWQLFSGFSDEAKSRQATHNYQSALSAEQDARRRLKEQVMVAWNNLETSKQRADLLENAVNIAGEVFDARKRLRDAGSDTALNVLDAENELFRAQIDATAARFDYYIAVYRLLLATGTLDAGVV